MELSTIPTVTYIFRPPQVQMQPADPKRERLWEFYGFAQGISVLKQHDGSYLQTAFPTTDNIDAALITYLGGHEYVVDAAEAAALTAAGYGGELEISGASGYGIGAYGVGPYGL